MNTAVAPKKEGKRWGGRVGRLECARVSVVEAGECCRLGRRRRRAGGEGEVGEGTDNRLKVTAR